MRAVWLTGLAAAALLAVLAAYLSPLHPGAIALQFAWTPRGFGTIVHQWSADDLLRYRRHLALDMLLLAAYGSFGWLLATRSRLFDAAGPALRRAARWLLPLAALADAAENALHAWLTEVPRFGLHAVYALSTGCSLLKWMLIAAFALVLAWALLRQRD